MAACLSAALFIFCFMSTDVYSREKMHLIGVVSTVSLQTQSLDGFKTGMMEAGYIEGENLTYLYRRITVPDETHIDGAIRELLSQNISILVSIGIEVDLRAKVFAERTGIPALFMGTSLPVERGLVETISHPGGNVTGVKVADSIPKALEWLLKTAPHTRLVYLPYNPDDPISGEVIAQLETISPQLGAELLPHRVQSADEAIAGIGKLPEDISAVFLIPSLTLDPMSVELSRAATLRKIPMGAAICVDETVLVTFCTDFFDAGKKASRLARQILSGMKPADLPVETTEVLLTINLKTAEEIGISIPEEILRQAQVINR